MIVTQSGPQNVDQVKMYFEAGDLFLSPEEYQREGAWGTAQKQLLIDTIFRDMDIPKFYLWKIDDATLVAGYPEGETRERYRRILAEKRRIDGDPNPFVYEVIDGQQRIRTILEFIGVRPPNEYCYRGAWHEPYCTLAETPMASGRAYRDLNAGQKIRFGNGRLTFMVLENATISEIRDMFLRLQNGTPLNAQQKRNAIGSRLRTVVNSVANYPFFTVSVTFGGEAAEHDRVAAQMLLLEHKEKIVSCTSQQLDKFYKSHLQVDVSPSVAKNVRRVVDMLGRIFPELTPGLNRSYALGIYWAMSRILTTYDIASDDFPIVRRNFIRLDQRRLEAMSRDYSNEGDDLYEELSDSMSRGTDGSERITARYEILTEFLFEDVSLRPHPQLDPNRNFTYEEKLILYRRAEGRCQIACGNFPCGKKVEFDDGTVDHVIPHSRGGRTTLENGRYARRSCNISRGTRDDFDPATECLLLTSRADPSDSETCA